MGKTKHVLLDLGRMWQPRSFLILIFTYTESLAPRWGGGNCRTCCYLHGRPTHLGILNCLYTLITFLFFVTSQKKPRQCTCLAADIFESDVWSVAGTFCQIVHRVVSCRKQSTCHARASLADRSDLNPTSSVLHKESKVTHRVRMVHNRWSIHRHGPVCLNLHDLIQYSS
jgi:hypothetical protein